jgi:hypothetical protein
MNCENFDALLDRYLDEELLPDELRDVDAHLADCPRCRHELAYAREVQQGLHDLAANRCPGNIVDATLTAVRDKQRQQWRAWWRPLLHWPQLATAAAVCGLAIFLASRFEPVTQAPIVLNGVETVADTGGRGMTGEDAPLIHDEAEEYYRQALSTLVYVMNTMNATDDYVQQKGFRDGVFRPMQSGFDKVFVQAATVKEEEL